MGPPFVVSLEHVTAFSSETANGSGMLLAAGYKLFHIEEKREDEAEQTPSTCSTNQGNQHFSYLAYCEFRTIKCLGHLHIVSMPLIKRWICF